MFAMCVVGAMVVSVACSRVLQLEHTLTYFILGLRPEIFLSFGSSERHNIVHLPSNLIMDVHTQKLIFIFSELPLNGGCRIHGNSTEALHKSGLGGGSNGGIMKQAGGIRQRQGLRRHLKNE